MRYTFTVTGKGDEHMTLLVALIGATAFAMLIYYVWILVRGDGQR